MAAVLLRRLLSSSFEEIYPGLAETMQMAIKTELLSSIQQETSPNIRKKVCDIAAELSRNLIGNRLAPPARRTFEVAAAQTSASLIIFFSSLFFLFYCLLCLDDDGNNQWQELLKFLFDSVNSDNVSLREAALHIFW